MGEQSVGVKVWVERRGFWPRPTREYVFHDCLICGPVGKGGYTTPEGEAGTHVINEAQRQHLRDKHGVAK